MTRRCRSLTSLSSNRCASLLLLRRGNANGVFGLAMIGPERLRELEPHAAGIRALHVPTTGITDYAAVTRKYAEIVMAANGTVLTGTKVVGIVRGSREVVVQTTRGPPRS